MEILELENKYIELLTFIISSNELESWIYENEYLIAKDYDDGIYDELIAIDYNSKELKHNLTKLLNIDFRRLEKYQILKLLRELELKQELNDNYENLFYDSDYYEFRGYFIFELNGLNFTINPIDSITKNIAFYKLKIEDKCNEFRNHFPCPGRFVLGLIRLVVNDKVRIVVNEEKELLDSIEYSKYMKLRSDEIRIRIGNHEIRVEKEKMNRL